MPTLICCLKAVIRWCCALQTIPQTGFSIYQKTKRRVVFLDLPQTIFIEKKWSHYFFSSYPIYVYVCNSSTFEIRLISQP